MAEALVEFDYKAQELDELTIKKGDIITNISFKPEGWWEGTLLNGKRGMFPDNFVKLIKTEDGVVTNSSTGRRCKVLFPYQPEKEDELELQVGDTIDIISEVEEGWWKGSLRNKIGVFPSNFVQEITDVKGEREAAVRKPKLSRDESGKAPRVMNSASFNSDILPSSKAENLADLPSLPPKPVKEYCRVIYKYPANNVDELNLHPGDLITIITKEGQDPGWWKGELKGKVGVFPDNFVEMITLEEASKTELKTKVTNRLGGMAISKSATTSSIDTLNLNSLSRKFSDSSKNSEEKVPPSVSKKPVLPPPPNKKPTSSLSSAKSVDSAQSGHTSSLGKGMSSSTTTIKNISTVVTESSSVSSSSSKWTAESTDMSDGISFSRQSYTLKTEKGGSEGSVSGVHISSIEAPSELNLDVVGRSSKKLVHPTATRAKAPKRRPPSGVYNLTKEELKNGGDGNEEEDEDLEEEEEVETEPVLVNGDAEGHRESDRPSNAPPPWVKELKLNQAMKSLQQQQGKTRVMIGMSSERSVSGLSTSERTITTMSSSEKSVMGVSERVQAAERASDRAERSVAGSPPEGRVVLRQTPSSGQPRPQSMVSSLRTIASSPPSSDLVTLSLKQWNQVLDRLASCEAEVGSLSRTVRELSGALDEERQRRALIQQELEKLTDLVTQV